MSFDSYVSHEGSSPSTGGGAPASAEGELDAGVSHQILGATAPGHLGQVLSGLPAGQHDQAVQFAHRAHGNAFVGEALQLRANGAAEAAHELAVAGTTGGETALPHGETIQRAFGPEHDLSGVRAHVGGAAAEASTAMNADAYTVGNHVAFAGSPSLHLAAHEAAHVVQQQAGVQLKGGVGQVGDAYEQHADSVADAVVAGQPAGHLLAAGAGGGGTAAVQRHALDVSGGDLDTVKARAGEDNMQVLSTDTNKATREKDQGVAVKDGKSMAKNPAFESKAAAFEHKFGAKVWADPRAKAATHQMAQTAKKYLVAKLGDWKKTNAQLMDQLKKLGSDNTAWSGSVGNKTEEHCQAIMDVFDKGNIAEQMCHLENFFMEVMAPAALDANKGAVDALIAASDGMDAEYFEEKRAAVAVKGKYGMIDTPAGTDVANQWHARMMRFQNETDEDKKRQGEQSQRTIGETGAELSERELALHEEKHAGFDASTSKVAWAEGVRIWIMNEQDKWVFAQRQASLPLGAGPSGTTNKCMQIAKLLGVSDPYAARMACIGYLLPAQHHTLIEILTGAHPHGAEFTPGQRVYRNLKPYSEEDLAATCGEGGKFPDELAGDTMSVA